MGLYDRPMIITFISNEKRNRLTGKKRRRNAKPGRNG